jgi:hypothetical protein
MILIILSKSGGFPQLAGASGPVTPQQVKAKRLEVRG